MVYTAHFRPFAPAGPRGRRCSRPRYHAAPPARCGAGGVRLGGGLPALTTRGRRRAVRREGPVLFELLERPDPYTVGHTTSRDGGSFDRLEQFLPGSAVVDGSAHVGGHAILEAPRRQDP